LKLAQITEITHSSATKILLLVLDGLGGLPLEPGGKTELETAHTPNLDALASQGGCGLHTPVAAGITPGSGPGHLGLFGYDPLAYTIGRGVLEALGIEFDLQPGDVAVRGNFCTLDAAGHIEDRRAGRIPTEESAPLCALLDSIQLPGARFFVRPVREHRFLVVARPDEAMQCDLDDTDPEQTGVPPLPVTARSSGSQPLAGLFSDWIDAARQALASQPRANMVLLRGFAELPDWPRFPDVFGLRAFAAAAYPMYRGVARLVGMDAVAVDDRLEALAEALESRIDDYDFFFLHVKGTDKAGEDGDFDRKVRIIEDVDAIIPRLLAAGPGVVLATGDHSTPARMRSHSWHPVPFLIHGGPSRGGGTIAFGETECGNGSLGRVRSWELMPLAVARAGRLSKYGA
jgi:2,3-bisphosphoglycerate-independent phosphoglycerate mutase